MNKRPVTRRSTPRYPTLREYVPPRYARLTLRVGAAAAAASALLSGCLRDPPPDWEEPGGTPPPPVYASESGVLAAIAAEAEGRGLALSPPAEEMTLRLIAQDPATEIAVDLTDPEGKAAFAYLSPSEQYGLSLYIDAELGDALIALNESGCPVSVYQDDESGLSVCLMDPSLEGEYSEEALRAAFAAFLTWLDEQGAG